MHTGLGSPRQPGAPTVHHPRLVQLRSLLNRQLISTLVLSTASFLILASGWLYWTLSWLPAQSPVAQEAASVREIGLSGLAVLTVWAGWHALLIVLGAVGFRARAAMQSLRSGQAYRATPASVLPGVLIVLYLIGIGLLILAAVIGGLIVILGAGSMTISDASADVLAETRRQARVTGAIATGWVCTALALLFASQVINYRGMITSSRIENTVRYQPYAH